MKKVSILTLHLGYGGIEKAVADLANILISNYDVEIVSVYKLYDKPAFTIDEKVKIKYLINSNLAKKVEVYKTKLLQGKIGSLFIELYKDYLKKLKFIALIKDTFNSMKILIDKNQKLIKYIENCDSDIIISAKHHHSILLSKYGKKGTLKIGCEHFHHNNERKYINNIKEKFINLDYLIALTEKLKNDYIEFLKKTNVKVELIPNSISVLSEKKPDFKDKNIISVGRFSKEKRIPLMLEMLKLLDEDVKLTLVGDGEEKDEIIKKIKELKLENKVIFTGFLPQGKVKKLLLKHSLFIMTSETEGLPMVLLEAMNEGLPCVAFETESGVKDIIDDGINGCIIKNSDIKLMAQKINDLLNNKEKLSKMSFNSKKKVKQFETSRIKEKWLKILQ